MKFAWLIQKKQGGFIVDSDDWGDSMDVHSGKR
jgi:hypothetical protein